MDMVPLVAGVVIVILALKIIDGVAKSLFSRPEQPAVNSGNKKICDALLGMPCSFCGQGRLHLVIETDGVPKLQCTSCGKVPTVD